MPNEAIKHIFEFESHEIIGKDVRIFYRSDTEYEAIGKLIYDKLEVGNIHKGMYPYRTKNGKDIICEITVLRMSDSQKNQVVAVFEDVTERIAAEKELSESEDKYRDLLENTHDIIMSISPEGKFIHVNTAWYKTFGYTTQELPSLKIEHIIQADNNLQLFNDQFALALQNKSTKSIDLPFISKQGVQVVLQGNLIPKSFYNKIVAVWGFYRDITEQKKDQEEIQNKIQELERFNKMVVDRELKMVELKEAIKKLQEQLANPRKDYP